VVGGTLAIREATGDTWLIGGSPVVGAPAQPEVWKMGEGPHAWTPVGLGAAGAVGTPTTLWPDLRAAAAVWDPVHKALLLAGPPQDLSPKTQIWTLEVDGDDIGFKQVIPQGQVPPAWESPVMGLSPGGDAVWFLGGEAGDPELSLFGLSLGTYTWTHLWSGGSEAGAVEDVVGVSRGHGLDLVVRRQDNTLHRARLEQADDGETWTWEEVGDASSPIYTEILSGALSPVGGSGLLLVAAVDATLKAVRVDPDKDGFVADDVVLAWDTPYGAAMGEHPTGGLLVVGGADALGITWGVTGAYALDCP
jgi:hypothetical protein